MQEKPSKACFRTSRGLDAADAVHSCFSSEGVFRGAHNNFDDENTCILQIKLTEGVLTADGVRYKMDFKE